MAFRANHTFTTENRPGEPQDERQGPQMTNRSARNGGQEVLTTNVFLWLNILDMLRGVEKRRSRPFLFFLRNLYVSPDLPKIETRTFHMLLTHKEDMPWMEF